MNTCLYFWLLFCLTALAVLICTNVTSSPSCVNVFSNSFFNFSLEEGKKICSVIYPRQKNLENLGIYLCMLKNVSFRHWKWTGSCFSKR